MTFQYLFDFSILQLYYRRDLEKAREERPTKESRVDRESTSPVLILIVASDQMTQASGHESQKKRIGKRKTIAKTPLLSSTTPAFPLLLPMIFSCEKKMQCIPVHMYGGTRAMMHAPFFYLTLQLGGTRTAYMYGSYSALCPNKTNIRMTWWIPLATRTR